MTGQDWSDNTAVKPFRADAIEKAFASCASEGIIALAGGASAPDWPLSWLFWRDFGGRYLASLCQHAPATGKPEPLPLPSPSDLALITLNTPPMPGAEYCNPDTLTAIWSDLDRWTAACIGSSGQGLPGFLKQHAPAWRQVGRVCFHLAENKKDPEFPFAFMATYIPRLGRNAKAQHQPLSQALSEFSGANNREALLRLLEPVYEAGTRCPWVKELLETGDIYHPLAWRPDEAYFFLKNVPELEASGLIVRLPDWWKSRPRPRVQVTIGNTVKNGFSAATLLDFQARVALGNDPITDEELASLLSAGQGLALLRGQWVEVDSEKLQQALEQWRSIASEAGADGLSFVEGMRLLAGVKRDLSSCDQTQEEQGWAFVEAGSRLREQLAYLREPATLAAVDPGESLKATLRPYQQTGLNWLRFMSELGLGACLADDMGLGKTIQVIALLLIQKSRQAEHPSLLVLPASLLANWKSEMSRFAPSLQVVSLHPSEIPAQELDRLSKAKETPFAGIDVVMTTYGMLQRQEWLRNLRWNIVALDEAQAIKNPGTQQAKAVKRLQARSRLALTGTPVENRLGDLWSLFDFLCPGLLGTANRFKEFAKSMESGEHPSYAPLRKLVQPYILRRLKTDKRVIDDLPDKVEMTAWCSLSKVQAQLYGQAVKDLAQSLKESEGMQRRGLILAALMRFKQICNHPGQALGTGDYPEEQSGKFARLREIVEEIASRQEKLLVFSQFREMTGPLASFLAQLFGRPGLVLHGGTAVSDRKNWWTVFSMKTAPPFLSCRLKPAEPA